MVDDVKRFWFVSSTITYFIEHTKLDNYVIFNIKAFKEGAVG